MVVKLFFLMMLILCGISNCIRFIEIIMVIIMVMESCRFMENCVVFCVVVVVCWCGMVLGVGSLC